jgi:undecaprenyl-diphosphatase
VSHHHLSWLEAGVIGLTQGVSELFPVSSLGHSVLIPAVVGGSWSRDLDVRSPESPYLAFIVGLHVATAIALICYFWRDWVRILHGLVTSIGRREVRTADQRLAWLLVLATIPVGLVGLIFEHWLRTNLARPIPTTIFLMLNGLLLLGIERGRRCSRERVGDEDGIDQEYVDERVSGPVSDARLSRLSVPTAVGIGTAQILALAPGISRSGAAMSGGLLRGLSREDAARFSFLLATPVILAAGALKLGDLTGPLGDGIRGQVLFGSVLSGVGAYLSVRFLTRYFAHRSLRPFGAYCLAAGAACLVYLTVR